MRVGGERNSLLLHITARYDTDSPSAPDRKYAVSYSKGNYPIREKREGRRKFIPLAEWLDRALRKDPTNTTLATHPKGESSRNTNNPMKHPQERTSYPPEDSPIKSKLKTPK